MAARSKAWVFGHSHADIVGSNHSLLRDALWEGIVPCASVNLLWTVPRASYCARKQFKTTGVRVCSTRCVEI